MPYTSEGVFYEAPWEDRGSLGTLGGTGTGTGGVGSTQGQGEFLSNPFSGQASIAKKGNIEKWFTGEHAFGDLTRMGQAGQIVWDPYQPGGVSQIGLPPETQAMLMAQARGTAPSAAELQMQAGMDRNLAQARALAASQRGVSPLLAQRMATQQSMGANLQMQQQMAAMRAQEQAAAQKNLATLQMEAARGNQQAQIQLEQIRADQAKKSADVAIAQAQADQQAKGGLFSAGGALVGSLFSDKALKKDISKADKDVEKMLGALRAYRFKYKDDKHGSGEYLGFMAQDAEKSEAGRSMVVNEPDGKAIDPKRALMLAIASAANLNKRVSSLEKKNAA